jgi:hypothetical protein
LVKLVAKMRAKLQENKELNFGLIKKEIFLLGMEPTYIAI